MPLRIGTRGSPLALVQTRAIVRLLTPCLGRPIDELIIKTTGDRTLDVGLSTIGGKGLFTKEIEEALLARRIDLAVHSLKDLPTRQPDGLVIAAIPPREDPWDALITRDNSPLDRLAAGARVGTSSLRRVAQLRHHRPDLLFVEMRGNVGTRLKKLADGECDALVLARAGLARLGKGARGRPIPETLMLHACGQGALAVECRADDPLAPLLTAHLDHPETRRAVTAERSFLAALEGGCQVPIGAHASLNGDTLVLEGVIASLDGATLLRERETGPTADGAAVGSRLAERLLARGGGEIIRAIARNVPIPES